MDIYSTVPPGFGDEIFAKEIPSSMDLKEDVISTVLNLLLEEGYVSPSEEIIARLCLDEAIINAIRHGNKFNESKKVALTVYGNETKWGVRIEDEGNGFDPEDLPSADDENYFERESGRGIMLITEYMDEVY